MLECGLSPHTTYGDDLGLRPFFLSFKLIVPEWVLLRILGRNTAMTLLDFAAKLIAIMLASSVIVSLIYFISEQVTKKQASKEIQNKSFCQKSE